MQKLVFLGIGSNNSDILDAVMEINALEPTYEVLGYVTRNGEPVNKGGLKHLGDFDTVRDLPEDVQITGFAFGPGSYHAWPGTVAGLGLPRERFATIVHPHAFVSPQSTVGRGFGCPGGDDGGRVRNHRRPRDHPAERGTVPRRRDRGLLLPGGGGELFGKRTGGTKLFPGNELHDNRRNDRRGKHGGRRDPHPPRRARGRGLGGQSGEVLEGRVIVSCRQR